MSAKQLWRWQGINNEGEPSEGVLWADTRLSLIQALEQRHITPLRIKRIRVKTLTGAVKEAPKPYISWQPY